MDVRVYLADPLLLITSQWVVSQWLQQLHPIYLWIQQKQVVDSLCAPSFMLLLLSHLQTLVNQFSSALDRQRSKVNQLEEDNINLKDDISSLKDRVESLKMKMSTCHDWFEMCSNGLSRYASLFRRINGLLMLTRPWPMFRRATKGLKIWTQRFDPL